MVRKMSLKEYLKKPEVFVPETRLHNTNLYNLLRINSFLNRNEQMILIMSLEKDNLKIITEEDLLNAQNEKELFDRQMEEDERRELPDNYLEKCEDDFSIVWEEYQFNDIQKHR